ncbi:MAG: LptF/LptG family permease, partial [Proteobacteria bacterium]|nr:LptF/LptG family permease [Pseudomonadota bacterium]
VDVFIEDQRNKQFVSTVVAPRGDLFSEAGNPSYHLRLYNGTINQVNLKNRSVHTISFDTYDVNLDLNKAIATAQQRIKDEKEMSLTELNTYIKSAGNKKNAQYYAALIEFHKKFSIAFACFALGILAVPLGVQRLSTGKSYGLGLGLICFLAYYLMLSAGWVFGEAGVYPPVIGMWAPNMVMGGLGLFLLVQTSNERPVGFGYLSGLIKLFFYRRRS